MTIQTLIALSVMGVYVTISRLYRIGKDARLLVKTKYDRGSTAIGRFAYLSSLLALGLGVVLAYRGVAAFENVWVSWAGVVLSLGGLLLRISAVGALGRFYTRAIRIIDGHEIVAAGVYRILRHPGYLGVLLIFLGAALAISSWVSLAYISLVLLPALARRAHVEEAMLIDHFGEAYRAYMIRTRPFFLWGSRHDRKARPDSSADSSPELVPRKGV